MPRNIGPALDRLHDPDATVILGAEENERLLSRSFGRENAPPPRPSTDDDITIDAPAPTGPHIAPLVARITQRPPPPLTALVLTSPPPPRQTTVVPGSPVTPAAAPPSGTRPRITPELARAAREQRAAEDARRKASAALSILKTNPQLLVVAGIWAMALSVAAMLLIIVAA